MKIRGFCRTFEGGGFYRVVLPLRELACHGHQTECVKATTETGPAGADIMVVHMAGTHEAGKMPEVHRWWRRTALKCRRVYELDDDPFELEDHNPAFADFNSAFARDSLAYCIQIADLVTTSVEPLAERMRKLNPNVVVCKNRIDESLLGIERPHRDRLTVGWAGGNSHLHDIQEAAYGLRRVIDWCPGVDVHLMGCDFRPLIRRPCRFTPWEPKVADYYRLIDFDIGIAPLRPSVFSEAKSAIKALEYGALGIPVVASDVAPYRDYVIDGVTGWLVRRPEQWVQRLRDLINDEAMRTEMSVKAKQQAAEWTIQKGWQDWENGYKSIL